MPIGWTPNERDAVDAILLAFPASSGRCFDAARNVFPIAQARDHTARAWRIRPHPGRGRFVVPKVSLGQRWFHHYTIEVEKHGVDAITGTDGTSWPAYLSTHWQYATDLACVETDLGNEEP